MQIKAKKTFYSKGRGCIFKKGEIIEGEPAWCNSLIMSGLAIATGGDRQEHVIKGKKRRLKIAGNKLETAEEPGDKVFLTGHRGYLGGIFLKSCSRLILSKALIYRMARIS